MHDLPLSTCSISDQNKNYNSGRGAASQNLSKFGSNCLGCFSRENENVKSLLTTDTK